MQLFNFIYLFILNKYIKIKIRIKKKQHTKTFILFEKGMGKSINLGNGKKNIYILYINFQCKTTFIILSKCVQKNLNNSFQLHLWYLVVF